MLTHACVIDPTDAALQRQKPHQPYVSTPYRSRATPSNTVPHQYSNTHVSTVTPSHNVVDISSSGAGTTTKVSQPNSNIRSQSNPYDSSKDNLSVENPYQKRASNENTRPKSLMRQQYPHREGRIRVDRQFSTAISIGGDFISSPQQHDGLDSANETYTTAVDLSASSSDNDDDELLTFIPFQNH